MSENNEIDLSDLNALALGEFIKAIKSNEELSPNLKEAIENLVKNGIPENLDKLEDLLGGLEDVENQTN